MAMDHLLQIVALPSGAELKIWQQYYEWEPGEFTPGLKFMTMGSRRVTLSEGASVLVKAGRQDILDYHNIPVERI